MKQIVILVTMDTKGEEALYLKSLIEDNGCHAAIMDCSLRPAIGRKADIDVNQLLDCIESTADKLSACDKDGAIAMMQAALRAKLLSLFQSHQLDGVISVGGVQGTVIATAGMQILPVGVPKYMVSTVANGNATFGPFVGGSDMAIMHSVVDIAGLNYVLKKVLSEAAGAICGMAKAKPVEPSGAKVVGITMAGVTTPCVTILKTLLEEKGYEVLIFHCNGVGAQVMENLVSEGAISFVLDISPHDIMDGLEEGLMPCYPRRLLPIVEAGIPLLFVPGSLDFILYNGEAKVPATKKDRAFYRHNAIHTHVRTSYEELASAGRFVAQRLQNIDSPCSIVIPQKGFSQMNAEGNALYDPVANAGFIDGLLQDKSPKIQIHKVDAHINDEAFGHYCMQLFLEMLEKQVESA